MNDSRFGMLFNSYEFLIFFAITYVIFFLTKGVYRQLTLFVSSCIFYAWFIPKYLLVLFLTIAIDYYAGITIEETSDARRKRISLIIAIFNTVIILFIFKYYNFFIDNLNWISNSSFPYWNIILPIGLSFHTFQNLSYVIDVYRGKIKAERNALIYANYVMMFPQLVAGPIERAGHLIPQIIASSTSRILSSDFVVGATLFFYGLFKKMVVADNIGPYVDAVYGNHMYHNGSTLLFATMLFAVQIYADFSGYSDMAIGTARMLGFRFNDNFRTPYFSRSVTEFWRNWHISLSSWLRDYLYYPVVFALGRISKVTLALSTLITFALIGLWHGANWTYVIFGLIHGIYLVVELFTDGWRKKLESLTGRTHLRHLHHAVDTALVFLLVSFSFIFFRSASFTQAVEIIKKIGEGVSFRDVQFLDTNGFGIMMSFATLLFLFEFFVSRKMSFDSIFERFGEKYMFGIVAASVIFVLSFGWWGGVSFIYFQF